MPGILLESVGPMFIKKVIEFFGNESTVCGFISI